ncbi:MAG: transglycosylase SLT domain-containing protein [Actinomycetota bacterium]
MQPPTTYRGSIDAGESFTSTIAKAQLPAPPTSGVNLSMTHLTRTRRHFPAALSIIVVLTLLPALSADAATSGGSRRYRYVSSQVCPIDWRQGTKQVKRLIMCAAHHWSVPGGRAKALRIAYRESRYHPRAYNSSGAEGIYQHMRSFWPNRAYMYGFKGWSAFDARANIIVTMRMVRRGGWGPWGG